MAWAWKPFHVVGPSMEPCLTDGDWLLVSKQTPQRDDLVVFREPDTGKYAVKRVAGVPGEAVQLVDGDLYLDGQVRQRRLGSVEDLVPMMDAVGEEVEAAMGLSKHGFTPSGERHWKLEGSGVAFLQRPPTANYLLRGNLIQGQLPAQDLGLEVEFDLLAASSELHLVLRKGQSTFFAVLSEQGSRLEVLQQDPTLNDPLVLLEVEIPAGASRGTAFFTLADHVITFVLNDEVVVEDLVYPAPLPHQNSELPLEFRKMEHAGVGGIGPLLVGRIRLGRDFLYRSSGTYGGAKALQLADGQYFLLGDNSPQSRDSRQYGPVPSERILGIVSSRAWPRGWTDRGWQVE